MRSVVKSWYGVAEYSTAVYRHCIALLRIGVVMSRGPEQSVGIV